MTQDKCTRCGRSFADDYEAQEAIHISFIAGYASIFGDGNTVSGTICQHCLQETLGSALTIRDAEEGAPIGSEQPDRLPRGAYQCYQERQELKTHMLQLLDDQLRLRRIAVGCLEIGSTLMASAALETALELPLYDETEGQGINRRALAMIEAGETETAEQLLRASLVPEAEWDKARAGKLDY